MPRPTPCITGKEQFLWHDGSDLLWSRVRTSGAHRPSPCQRGVILMQQIPLAPHLLSVFPVGLLPSSLPMQRHGSSLTPARPGKPRLIPPPGTGPPLILSPYIVFLRCLFPVLGGSIFTLFEGCESVNQNKPSLDVNWCRDSGTN